MTRSFAGANAPDSPAPQRATGSAHFVLEEADGPRVRSLFQRGSAKVRFTRNTPWAPADNAVLINTAGGVAGGDRFDWNADIKRNARCTIVTQACEKAYRSDGETAEVAVRLSVAPGARLDWLPQETILFEGARLSRHYAIELAQDAAFFAVEAVILGRRAMGEAVSTASLNDVWRVRRDNRLIFADAFRLDGAVTSLKAQAALLRGVGAYALVLLVAKDAERHLHVVRALMDSAGADNRGGASAFDGKLIVRISALDSFALRKSLIPVMTALRDGVPPPRLWTV